MAVLLSCQSLTKAYGTHVLFDGLTFGVDERERLGLIGPNGSGKSTLLKIIAGREQPDRGTIMQRRMLRLGYVPQVDAFADGMTADSILTAALAPLQLDEREQRNRINTLLGRIGFQPDWRSAPVETLSGGWRKRVALAAELVGDPELLILDEPTNHLDLEGILWLEKLLAGATFATLMVSHDRFFLDTAATRVMELNRCYPGGFFSAPGSYSEFLNRREDFLAGQLQAQRSLESKVRREIEWLKRGPPARTTKSRSRIDAAGELMDELAAVKFRNAQTGAAKIDFVSTERQANKLVAVKGVHKSLGERKLIGGLDLVLAPGMKLGLLGANGSGKTTLLRLLAGELQPDAGLIERAEKLRVVYFDQTREQLDQEATLRKALAPTGDMVTFRDQPLHVSAWAKPFLFTNEQLEMPVKSLSGGEQARILIAKLMLRPADLLLLDEPTNDLDIPSLQVLEESLAEFPGAVVLVTHDRFMLRRLATEILAFDGAGGVALYSDFSQWVNAREAAREQVVAAKKADTPKTVAKESAKTAKKLSFKEQREFEQMEGAILEAEAAVAALQQELEAPAVAADPQRLNACCKALADAQARVDSLYARWQELEAKQQ